MNVVLLGASKAEARNPHRHWVSRINHVHIEVDQATGVRHPLAVNHPLVCDSITVAIDDAAVPAGESHAGLHHVQQRGFTSRRNAGLVTHWTISDIDSRYARSS